MKVNKLWVLWGSQQREWNQLDVGRELLYTESLLIDTSGVLSHKDHVTLRWTWGNMLHLGADVVPHG